MQGAWASPVFSGISCFFNVMLSGTGSGGLGYTKLSDRFLIKCGYQVFCRCYCFLMQDLVKNFCCLGPISLQKSLNGCDIPGTFL